MYRKQVTMIDDLMDLESQGPPSMMPNQSTGLPTDPDTSFTQKFIRDKDFEKNTIFATKQKIEISN